MQNQNQLFEDFARLMSGIAGTMAGAGREAEQKMKEKMREVVGGDDWVSRDEFEALRAMVTALKDEVDALKDGKETKVTRDPKPGKTIPID